MNSNHITYEPASCNRLAGRGNLQPSGGTRRGVVECNLRSVSELGVFRVVETVTLEMVNRLWGRDLCATPYVKMTQ